MKKKKKRKRKERKEGTKGFIYTHRKEQSITVQNMKPERD